ncbi:hypothetical protein TrVE_jg11222 [Triparma verrucosa]|uniref:Uncharacterized protein n=1 Tax=Triparma verrucosa TaxID=1606542 RepID=A0A9W7CG86_9STRA|nr:hypothetical protein TrVE_jg11222 [Triparma verrucosa]
MSIVPKTAATTTTTEDPNSNINNTKYSKINKISNSIDGIPGIFLQMDLLKNFHSRYKTSNVQPTPAHLQSAKTAASLLALLAKTSHPFREAMISVHVNLLPRLFHDTASPSLPFISLCCLRTLFVLSFHTSATQHTATLLCRRNVVEALIQYFLSGVGNNIVTDLCLRSLTKLAVEAIQEVAARIVSSPLALDFFKTLSACIKNQIKNGPSPQSTPTNFDRNVLASQMALSLLDMLTSPSDYVDLNNSKKMLCTLAFDGGGLDVAIELLDGSGRQKRSGNGAAEGGAEEDDEDEEEADEEEVRFSLSTNGRRSSAQGGEDIAKRIVLNILEADRPRRAGGVAPAFLRACCMGWLRRAPGVLVGGRGDGIMQRISLLMISRALEFGGSKHVFDESKEKKGDSRRATSMALAQQSTTNALRSGSADNLTKSVAKTNRRRTMERLPTKKKEGGGKIQQFMKDTSKLLKSKASTINFVCTSGCLNSITHMLAHYDSTVRSYAVAVFDVLLKKFEGGEDMQMALIEQACVPSLFVMCKVGKRQYSPSFFVAQKVLTRLSKMVAEDEATGGSVLTKFGRRCMNTLGVSGSTALRSNISCALLLLTLENAKARQELVAFGQEAGELGLLGVLVGLISTGGRASTGARPFLASVDCLLSADERDVAQGEGAVGEENRFYGDFKRCNVNENLEDPEDLRPLVVYVVEEGETRGVKMECPSLVEIREIVPELAAKLKSQRAADLELSVEASSYAAAEEFFSHVACGWVGLEKGRKKWGLDFSIELLKLASFYKSSALKAAYARCCYELISRHNAVRIFNEAIGLGEKWLAMMAFKRVVGDFDGVAAAQNGQGGGREFVKVIEKFLGKVV